MAFTSYFVFLLAFAQTSVLELNSYRFNLVPEYLSLRCLAAQSCRKNGNGCDVLVGAVFDSKKSEGQIMLKGRKEGSIMGPGGTHCGRRGAPGGSSQFLRHSISRKARRFSCYGFIWVAYRLSYGHRYSKTMATAGRRCKQLVMSGMKGERGCRPMLFVSSLKQT